VAGDGNAAHQVMLQHINTSLGAKAASRLGVESPLFDPVRLT
jgi:hypothetical protein